MTSVFVCFMFFSIVIMFTMYRYFLRRIDELERTNNSFHRLIRDHMINLSAHSERGVETTKMRMGLDYDHTKVNSVR